MNRSRLFFRPIIFEHPQRRVSPSLLNRIALSQDFLSWVQDQLKQQTRAAPAPPAADNGAASPTKPPPIPLDHVLDLLHEYGDKLERTTSGDVLRTSPSGTLFRSSSSGANCFECLKRTSSVASSLAEDDVTHAGQPAADAAGGEVLPAAAKEAAPLTKKELAVEDRVVFIGSTAAKNSTFTTFGWVPARGSVGSWQ